MLLQVTAVKSLVAFAFHPQPLILGQTARKSHFNPRQRPEVKCSSSREPRIVDLPAAMTLQKNLRSPSPLLPSTMTVPPSAARGPQNQ